MGWLCADASAHPCISLRNPWDDVTQKSPGRAAACDGGRTSGSVDAALNLLGSAEKLAGHGVQQCWRQRPSAICLLSTRACRLVFDRLFIHGHAGTSTPCVPYAGPGRRC